MAYNPNEDLELQAAINESMQPQLTREQLFDAELLQAMEQSTRLNQAGHGPDADLQRVLEESKREAENAEQNAAVEFDEIPLELRTDFLRADNKRKSEHAGQALSAKNSRAQDQTTQAAARSTVQAATRSNNHQENVEMLAILQTIEKTLQREYLKLKAFAIRIKGISKDTNKDPNLELSEAQTCYAGIEEIGAESIQRMKEYKTLAEALQHQHAGNSMKSQAYLKGYQIEELFMTNVSEVTQYLLLLKANLRLKIERQQKQQQEMQKHQKQQQQPQPPIQAVTAGKANKVNGYSVRFAEPIPKAIPTVAPIAVPVIPAIPAVVPVAMPGPRTILFVKPTEPALAPAKTKRPLPFVATTQGLRAIRRTSITQQSGLANGVNGAHAAPAAVHSANGASVAGAATPVVAQDSAPAKRVVKRFDRTKV